MNNIRLLNQNDLDSYIELMKFGHHKNDNDVYVSNKIFFMNVNIFTCTK